MDVTAIGPVASPTVSFSATEHANKLFQASEEAQPAASVAESPALAANVATSANYSPAVSAQAAHFQLLAQAGAFAALHHIARNTEAPPADSVAKVGGVDGASVGHLK